MKQKLLLKTMLLLCALVVGSSAWADVTDEINNSATSSDLGGTATSTWATDFSITGTSGAQYVIHSMGTKNTSNALQWNKNGFLYTTTSGGTLKSVSIKGTPSKKINVFASNTAFSAEPTGTVLQQLTLSSDEVTYDFTSNYSFIALHGVDSSTQIEYITISYKGGGDAPTTYSVTYNANGATSGSVPTDVNSYEANASVTVLDNTGNLAKTGNAFGGWNTQADGLGTNYSAESTFYITANTTLYAKWNPYSITAQSNNTNYGTVSLSGNVITGSPNSGYRYASPAYTVSPANSATVVQAGNEFTVTPSENTTVTINFEPIPCYTVTLSDDTENPMTEYSPGVGCTLPTRSAIGSYEFAGWSETNVSAETTETPTIILAGTYYPTANITLYPVYSKIEGGGGTINKTTSVTISDYASANNWVNSERYTSITMDENVTATGKSNGNNSKYYSSSPGTWRHYGGDSGEITITTTSGTLTNVTITYSGNTLKYGNGDVTSGTAIAVSGASAVFNVSGSSGNTQVSIISVDYTITDSGTTYYWSSPVAATVEKPVITLADNPFLFSTTATITCATEGAFIKYSFDGENWSDYSTALTITETKTIYAKAIKGEDKSAVASVTATKNLATPTVTVGGDLTVDLDGGTNVSAGTLSAAVTYNDAAVVGASVTWSSSNTDIATINETTGAVTIKSTGEVTFTATYAGNNDYTEATGTKTVNVIDKPTILVEDSEVTFGSTFTVDDTKIVGGTITVTSSNTNVATVNGLVITPVAVGTTTITVSTAANGTYKAGSETFTLTVKAPVGGTTAMTANDIVLFHETFGNNSGSARDWSDSYSVKSGVSAVYSGIANYTVSNAKQGKNTTGFTDSGLNQSSSNTDAYIIIGPLNVADYEDMTLTYQWKAVSIKETYSTSASYATSSTGDYSNLVLNEGTGVGATSFVECAYSLPEEAQLSTLYLKIVWNTSNTQAIIDEVNLSCPGSATESVTLNGSGYATFCSQYPLDFTNADGYSAWQITGVSGENITFSQITGTIKGGQGILLKGTPSATVTLTSADSDNTLDGNKLFGTLAPTCVAANQYYGLSGKTFVKVNAGTVPAGKALLPASAVGDASRLTFVFEDANGIANVNVNENDNRYYDLQGRRVDNPTKGLYIVNGKKIIVK